MLRFSAALTGKHGHIFLMTTPSRTAYLGRSLFFGDVDLVRYQDQSPFMSAHPSNLRLVQFSVLRRAIIWHKFFVSPPSRRRGRSVLTPYISLLVAPQQTCPPSQRNKNRNNKHEIERKEQQRKPWYVTPLQPDPPGNTWLDLEYGLD